ncbi:hypothetical protein BP00DRAFT_230022 [Aspergillus indologenus CBS 114.80]|uniref:Uncharacterized protein n=1 Tax=Aspergillus indologenus CBS 114.80 TaxID=1450541 RepID=A0A2V5IYZ5_9EURO|nr:hypothetical protein BP00DRAFT_230022 [Aspergillus indologenus CBS 114.80]
MALTAWMWKKILRFGELLYSKPHISGSHAVSYSKYSKLWWLRLSLNIASISDFLSELSHMSKIYAGDLIPKFVTIKSHDANHPTPNKDLLALHAAVGNILHASEHGESIGKILKHIEDGAGNIIAPDGSTVWPLQGYNSFPNLNVFESSRLMLIFSGR